MAKGYIKYEVSIFNSGIKSLLSLLPKELKQNVLDVGCGKGKMLWFFNKCGINKCDGLELSQSLCECARNNLKILNISSDVINENAVNFEGYRNYSLFYFYNPFEADVMSIVIKNIEQIIEMNPRKVAIIYNNPICHQEVVNNNVFHLISKKDGIFRKLTGCKLFLYVNF